jgi:hypothetical protein
MFGFKASRGESEWDESSDDDSWSVSNVESTESKGPFTLFGFNLFESEETLQMGHKKSTSSEIHDDNDSERGLFGLRRPHENKNSSGDNEKLSVAEKVVSRRRLQKHQSVLKDAFVDDTTIACAPFVATFPVSDMNDETSTKICTLPRRGFWKPHSKQIANSPKGVFTSTPNESNSHASLWKPKSVNTSFQGSIPDNQREISDEKSILFHMLHMGQKRSNGSSDAMEPSFMYKIKDGGNRSRTIGYVKPSDIHFLQQHLPFSKNEFAKTKELTQQQSFHSYDSRDDVDVSNSRFDVLNMRESVANNLVVQNMLRSKNVSFRKEEVLPDGIADKRCLPSWPFKRRPGSPQLFLNVNDVEAINISKPPLVSPPSSITIPQEEKHPSKNLTKNSESQRPLLRQSSPAARYTTKVPSIDFSDDIWDEATTTSGWFSLGSLDAR